jgi:hypothetical protein
VKSLTGPGQECTEVGATTKLSVACLMLSERKAVQWVALMVHWLARYCNDLLTSRTLYSTRLTRCQYDARDHLASTEAHKEHHFHDRCSPTFQRCRSFVKNGRRQSQGPLPFMLALFPRLMILLKFDLLRNASM